MAVRGNEAKDAVTKQILEKFPGSFIYNKEIRIPYKEGNEIVQLKFSLTCAKDNVEGSPEVLFNDSAEAAEDTPPWIAPDRPSKEETNNLEKLFSNFNF